MLVDVVERAGFQDALKIACLVVIRLLNETPIPGSGVS